MNTDHPERATEDRALEAAAREIAENAHVLPWNVERMRSAVLAIMRRHGLRGDIPPCGCRLRGCPYCDPKRARTTTEGEP